MTKETEQQKLDRLMREARELQEQTAAGQAEAAGAKKVGNIITDTKAVREAARNINGFARVCTQIGKSIYGAGKPVFDFAFKVGRGYMNLFNKICSKKDKETGEKKLIKWRAYAMSALSLFAVSGAIPGAVGAPAREIIYTPIVDGIGMAVNFKSKETLYLTDSQEIGGERNEFGVKGCRTYQTGEVCNGVNFRVHHSFAHNVWATLARGNPFYASDVEVNEISPVVRCEVTSYGFRGRLFQMLDIYPTMLTAENCTPIFNTSAPRTASTAEATPASAANINVSASARFTQ